MKYINKNANEIRNRLPKRQYVILGFGRYEGREGVLLCEKIKTKPKPKTKTKPFEKDKILTLLSRAFSENTNEIYTYQACFWKDNMILGFGRDEGREGVLLGKAGVSVPKPIRLTSHRK